VGPVRGPVCPRPGPGRCRPRPGGPGPPAAARRPSGPGADRAPAGPDRARDDLAGPVADAILAAPGQHDGHATAAARLTRAVISWDSGQIGDALGFLRDAARHGTGISPDARQVQPLLALAAALVDLRQLGAADNILRAADQPALRNIPAAAALSILRARIHMAVGRLDAAAADADEALAIARDLGAHRYAATAHSALAVIALRCGDIAAAAHHLTSRPATGPQFADLYARPETTIAEAQITEAHDGPAAALGPLRQLRADLEARPGLLLGDPALAAWLARTAPAARATAS
jgi:tetratricopeptide (TPR) repeat protein